MEQTLAGLEVLARLRPGHPFTLHPSAVVGEPEVVAIARAAVRGLTGAAAAAVYAKVMEEIKGAEGPLTSARRRRWRRAAAAG